MPQSAPSSAQRDHGGNLDAAITQYGGSRRDWLDLSTGINPTPYPLSTLAPSDWTDLPDAAAQSGLADAARSFWQVPQAASILPAPGASALIARLPGLAAIGRVRITPPTYNEHAAAFAAAGWSVTDTGKADARVLVHPNNPDGRLFCADDVSAPLTIIDESFCDVMPDKSLIAEATRPGVVILKSFGKFWGLAGLRLGFAIAHPATIAPLRDMLGPWSVSGPALRIGTQALCDSDWAAKTRLALAEARTRLDRAMTGAGAEIRGVTDLFGLYQVEDAALWQDRLARAHVWTRIFPYSRTLIRLGLPSSDHWAKLETAL